MPKKKLFVEKWVRYLNTPWDINDPTTYRRRGQSFAEAVICAIKENTPVFLVAMLEILRAGGDTKVAVLESCMRFLTFCLYSPNRADVPEDRFDRKHPWVKYDLRFRREVRRLAEAIQTEQDCAVGHTAMAILPNIDRSPATILAVALARWACLSSTPAKSKGSDDHLTPMDFEIRVPGFIKEWGVVMLLTATQQKPEWLRDQMQAVIETVHRDIKSNRYLIMLNNGETPSSEEYELAKEFLAQAEALI